MYSTEYIYTSYFEKYNPYFLWWSTNAKENAQDKSRKVEKFVANILSGIFTYQIQKPELDDTSVVDAAAS
jgi:hypothetical protein